MTTTSSTTGLISSLGVGSGLDLSGMLTKLMTVEQQPLVLLQQQEASYQAKLSAYGTLQSALSTFQSSVQSLTDASQFTAISATSSNTSALGVTADSSAAMGTYDVQVNALAQSQKIATAGVADATASIGTGTLVIQFGTISGGSLSNGVYTGASFAVNANAPAQSLTIDSAHSSLSGIRDAINGANLGVTAQIVNDGSSNGYHLVLVSNNTGAANSMKITASGALASYFGYDPAGTQNMTQQEAGQNASLSVDGMNITSASNTVSGAIQGVSMNLSGTTSAPVTVTVSQDTSKATTAVNGFVKAFNDLNTTFTTLAGYDASTKTAVTLESDFSVSMMLNQIKQTIAASFTGLDGSTTNLANIGITFQKDGTLAVDSTALSNALTKNPSVFAGFFAATGLASDSLVKYQSAGANARPGVYAVNVSQPATQGSYTGGSAVATPLTITAGSNDTLSLTVDGVQGTLTLDAGTYSADQLVAELQSKINGVQAFSSAGVAVTVSQTGGVLTIQSNRYGSASGVSAISGSASGALGLAAGSSVAGLDVAGTIGGYAATGSGQSLTGVAGSAVDSIKLQILGNSSGDRGTVAFSQGIAYQLNNLLTNMLGSGGMVATGEDAINQSIKDLQQQQTDMQNHLNDVQAMYQQQFANLDTLIASMNQTSTYLTQQLANLPKTTGG